MDTEQQHESPATLLPTEVIEDWNRRLQAAGCSEQHRSELRNVIIHTLPFPSFNSMEVCVSGYTAACYDKPAVGPEKMVVSSVLTQLELAGQLETSSRYAQSYPVAAAIKKITNAASNLQVEPDRWLSFFLGLCQRALHHPESLTPSSYYHHTISVRDVTLFVLHSQVTGAVRADQSVPQACSQLHTWFENAAENGEPMPIPIASVNNLDDKTDVTCKLLSGKLTFGVPSVRRNREESSNQSGGKARPSQRQSTQANPLPKELTDLKASRPRRKIPRRQSLAYALEEGAETIPQPTAQGAESEDAEARLDNTMIESAEIHVPPESTPSERRRHYVSLLNIQASQNTLSRSDMQRFSRRQLSTWLEQFTNEEPLIACFLFLVWTMGMSPDRLQMLCVGTHAPSADEDIVLNPLTHRLTYRVLNLGATPEIGGEVGSMAMPKNHVMQLVLPASLVSLIIAAGRPQPFLGTKKRYAALRKRIEKASGSRPCSLTHWAASTASFEIERFNTLESGVKRGTMAFNEVASSAYRAQNLATLNQKFADCLTDLRVYWHAEGLMSGPKTEAFTDLTVTGERPEGILGSRRHAPPEALAPSVRAIRNAIKQAHQQLNTPYIKRPLSDLLALANLQQLNFFLILQLHTLGRALNTKTTIGLTPEGLWVSDKASHRYRERKLICSITPEDFEKNRGLFLTQRQLCRHTHQKLAELARTLSLKIKLADSAVADLPCYVSYLPPQGSIKVVRLTPARWQQAIDELGLSESWTTPGNVFRHLASTALSASLSDAVVDEVLGHKHPGKDWWASESAGSLTELTVLAPIIEDWAERMGLRVIKLDDRVFGGFYDLS